MGKSAGEAELELQLKAAKIEYHREFRFDPVRRWRADFMLKPALGQALWLVEVEGGAFNGGHRRGLEANKDCERSNAAVMAGFRVLRFTPYMVETGEAIDTIATALGITL